LDAKIAPQGVVIAREFAAKAKEYTNSLPPDHWEKTKIERDEFEAQYAKQLRFEADFNEWLQLRSKQDEDETDEQQSARSDCEDELIQRILTAPVACDWMIFYKFEVVEHCLALHGEASWGELIALTAFSAIKADILRHGLLREAHLYEK
jgi:hypothetical protein